jgi:hypothetical protein
MLFPQLCGLVVLVCAAVLAVCGLPYLAMPATCVGFALAFLTGDDDEE